MPRALRVCTTSGCPNLTTGGRCDICKGRAEQTRGGSTARGYGYQHQQRFRRKVLTRDPLCTCTDQTHGHGARCWEQSSVADHWPSSQRELIAAGLDAHDPANGRGLCKTCHDKSTAHVQPGGWHRSGAA